MLRNPTLWRFAGCVALVAVTTGGYLGGRLPAVWAILLDTLAAYLLFTVLHDATHGTGHAYHRGNLVLGRICGALLTLAWPLFHAVHHAHHAHTNDGTRDPDLFVSRTPRLLLPLWCVGVVIEYRVKFFGQRLWRSRGELVEAVATDLGVVGLIAVAAAYAWLWPLAVLWGIPSCSRCSCWRSRSISSRTTPTTRRRATRTRASCRDAC